MKIIQSFWTKPFLEADSIILDSRFNGGWINRKYNYLSWVLSCFQLRKYYDQVELITDELGKSILIDKLGLPYTSVSTELENIKHNNTCLWALGKIYAYSLQREPFLHVDNDVFIFNKFDENLIGSELVAQNLEGRTKEYAETFQEMTRKFPYIPDYLYELLGRQYITCSNAGIIGGADIPFFQTYTREVFQFLLHNTEAIEKHRSYLNSAYVNVVAEQVFFTKLAEKEDKKINYLFPNTDNIPEGIGLFQESGNNKDFVHCLGAYKKQQIVYRVMEILVKEKYTSHYEKTLKLLQSSEL